MDSRVCCPQLPVPQLDAGHALPTHCGKAGAGRVRQPGRRFLPHWLQHGTRGRAIGAETAAMTAIYLLRHGEADYRPIRERQWPGSMADLAPLTARGLQQAVAAAVPEWSLAPVVTALMALAVSL